MTNNFSHKRDDHHAHAEPSGLGTREDTTYGPLDTLKPLTESVWIVDSVVGPGLPVRMTVIRLASGDLLLHSPTKHSPALQRALEAIGPIRHLVAPNSAHWMFVKPWQTEITNTTTWAAPGLGRRRTVRRSGLRIDRELSDVAPDTWADEIDHAVVHGGAGFAEVAMFHRPSRTVLMTDLVQNFERAKLPWFLRPVARLLGNLGPEGRAPAHLRALVHLGKAGPDAARRIVAWAPQRILVTHGAPIEVDAAAKLRRSLAWLTGEKST